MRTGGAIVSARAVLSALALLAALTPGQAAACAVCLGAAFGDRSYTWPYLGLILMPFVIGGAILGVLAWQLGWRPRDVATRLTATLRRVAPGDSSPRTHTETT
jgi:hypothetical protein